MTRTRTARVAALAAPALLVLSLSACGGGGSDAPEDASKDEFCGAYNADPDLDESLATASPDEQASAIKDALDQVTGDLEDVGTPSDIPDDARDGFQISIDAAKDLSEDEIKKAIEEQDSDVFDSAVEGDDKEKVDAFDEWADDYCGDAGSSGGESEAPSDDAS